MWAALLVAGAGALCLPGAHMETDIERQAVYISRLNPSTLQLQFFYSYIYILTSALRILKDSLKTSSCSCGLNIDLDKTSLT